MIGLAMGMAWLVVLAIAAIGLNYLARPLAATRSFGLPLPEAGPNIAWWLRLKGVRDLGAGLILLAFLVLGQPRDVGIVLLTAATIPLGDMSVILAANGSRSSAFGIHGLTALVMVLTAMALLIGGR